MMFFTSLLISLPYSSTHVTSRDGNSLNLLKLFILCFDSRGQFGSAHRFSAQFSNTYKVRLICIVCSKQPFVLLAKVQFTYTVRPTQLIHSSLAQYSTHTRIPRKSVSRFIFVFSRRCKNSTPTFPLAYKSTIRRLRLICLHIKPIQRC